MNAIQKIKRLIREKRFFSAYFKNGQIRLYVYLALGLITNVVYIVFNTVSGIRYRDLWFITVAIYYSIIVVIRYTILNVRHRKDALDYKLHANKAAFISGLLLLLLTAPTTLMIGYTLTENKVKNYSPTVFYILTIYTLYSIIVAFRGIKSKPYYKDPKERTAYTLRLVCALMSLFNLETVIIFSFFASSEISIRIEIFSGVAISIIIFILALNTVIKSRKTLHMICKSKSIDEKY